MILYIYVHIATGIYMYLGVCTCVHMYAHVCTCMYCVAIVIVNVNVNVANVNANGDVLYACAYNIGLQYLAAQAATSLHDCGSAGVIGALFSLKFTW